MAVKTGTSIKQFTIDKMQENKPVLMGEKELRELAEKVVKADMKKAQKKAPKKAPVNVEAVADQEEEKESVNVKISKKTRQRLKVYCAENGYKMGDFIAGLVEDALNKAGK